MPAVAARMDQKVRGGATHEVHIEAQSAIAVGKRIDAVASARLHRDSTVHARVCVRHVRDVRAFVRHTRARVATHRAFGVCEGCVCTYTTHVHIIYGMADIP